MLGQVSGRNIGGIITIGVVSHSWASVGLSKLFFFLCMLSMNLAFLNVLPIPVFDGGHLLFLLIEKVKGSPVSERVLSYSQMVGIVLIVSLTAGACSGGKDGGPPTQPSGTVSPAARPLSLTSSWFDPGPASTFSGPASASRVPATDVTTTVSSPAPGRYPTFLPRATKSRLIRRACDFGCNRMNGRCA